MGSLGQVLLLGLATTVLGLRRGDFYPYGASEGHKAIRSGDDQQANLNTRVPVILNNAQLTAIFVHTDGFLKFEPTPLGEKAYDFSRPTYLSNYPTRLIAPFLADFDTSSDAGYVWYGSTNDEYYLRRAKQDIWRYMNKDFQPRSVLIFTWEDVRQKGDVESATFQLALATDGSSTYGLFMYEDPINEPSLITNYPQAGVTLGDRRSYFTLPGSASSSAFDLYLTTNVGRPGLFVYDLRAEFSSSEPEGSGAEPTDEIPFVITTETPVEETSNQDDCSQCHENGGCRQFTDGECCVCADGYIGNGLGCTLKNTDIRASGLMNGNINGVPFVDLDLHTFGVINEGRAYVAVSPVDEDLGLTMQILSTIGEFMGWMFSLPDDDKSVNGFQLTGGKLLRDAYVSVDGGYEVRIVQEFLGFDNLGQLQVNTNVEGTLPVISKSDGTVAYDEHKVVYERKEPGRIRSVSTRVVRFNDFSITYNVDQTITYQECTADERDRPSGQDSMSLNIIQQYTSFDIDENQGNILRFATASKIGPSDQTVVDPCANNDCSSYGICTPRGNSFYCTCNDGYEGDGYNCRPRDICATVDCGSDAYCAVVAAGYTCVCTSPGYTWDGFNCRGPCEAEICPSNAYCQEDVSGNAQCICLENYRQEGGYCVAVDACDGFICVDNNARCQLDQYNLAICICIDGYTLTGDTCVAVACAPYVCNENAHCETRDGVTGCYCNDGFDVVDNVCVEIPIGDPCASNACDQYAGDCKPFGQTYTCECLAGFEGNGFVCTDINECNLGIHDCHSQARCENYQGSYNCVCRDGYEGDGRSCIASPVGDKDGFLIFAQSNSLMSLPLNGQPGRKVYMNSRQTIIGVGYDCRNEVIYWTDIASRTINSVYRDGTGATVLIRSGLLSPEGIAVDWVSRNMYWTDSGYHRIEVSQLDGSHRRILFEDNMKQPRSVVVDPVGGNLYWTDWTRSNPKIEMSALDGSNRRVMVSQNIKLPNGLTIDYRSQQICWADAGTRKVECMNLDGDISSRFTVTSKANYPFSITVNSNIFYWTDWRSGKIENVGKNDDSLGTPLQSPPGGSGRLYGIVVADTCPAGSNACAYNNGDCSALCLPKPGNEKTCACGSYSDGNAIPCEEAP
ncbi:nidogen-1-like isoform X3 [Antedon mediterranea]|uniref:nidogen-1-like isoform X3 n=1 Tax=Antedon mediterranea TaxID=105859 RepID=UPI003AF9F6E3